MKRIRNAVRTETSIRADMVLNDVLHQFEAEFDRRVAAGEPYELNALGDWIAKAVEEKIPVAIGA